MGGGIAGFIVGMPEQGDGSRIYGVVDDSLNGRGDALIDLAERNLLR